MIQEVADLFGPFFPGEIFLVADALGGAVFGVFAADLEVAEFGVGDKLAVDEDGGADAGAEGEKNDDARLVATGPELDFGNAGGVGVVDDVSGSADVGRERAPPSVSIQLLSTLAAERIMPFLTTPGKVMPAGPEYSK